MKLCCLITLFILSFNTGASQEVNREIAITGQPPFLIGEITIEELSTKSYASWFKQNMENYTPNSKLVKTLKDELSTYNILVFVGTWCGDSKREVPRFIKILETTNFPMEQLKLVAVDKRKDYYKKSPQGEEWGLNIKRVPTFIFYKNGREVNRIVESPVSSLEDDIKAIVTGNSYLPNYSNSLHFD